MTKDQIAGLVAVAVLAAAKEVAPDDVCRVALAYAIGNQRGRSGPVAKVRGYAAVALHSRTGLSNGAIGRMVGTPAAIVWRMRTRPPDWWQDRTLDRVGEALDAYLAGGWVLGLRKPETAPRAAASDPGRPPAVAIPRFLPSRPSAPGKRALLDDLRRAVENTARMTRQD